MPDLIPQEHGGKLNRFKAGEIGNPNGRPRKWISQLKNGYTKSQVVDCIQAVITMSKEELTEVEADEDNSMLERIVAKAILEGHRKGTLYNIETLLTRVYGQPKQEIDQTITVTTFNISLNLNGDVPPKSDP